MCGRQRRTPDCKGREKTILLVRRHSGSAVRKALSSRTWGRDLSVRQIVAALLLLLFSSTNYAIQTHIHDAPSGHGPATVAVFGPAHGTPADNDEQHCPLCQEFLGGNFLLPGAQTLIPPGFTGSTQMPAPVTALARAQAHGWLGRGPPAN